MRRLFLAVHVIAIAISAQASQIEIVSRPATAMIDVKSTPGTLTASAVVMRNTQEPRTVPFSIPGRAVLDLPEGVWRLQIKAPGWFHAGDIVTIGKDDTSKVVPVWLLGAIRGKVKTSDGADLQTLTARWSTGAVEGGGLVPDGEVACTIAGDEYRCAVPASLLDLKLRASGYGSHFLWQVNVPPAEVAELPRIQFKRGAGIFGWVNAGAGVMFDRERTRVLLSPVSNSTAPTRPIGATVNDRGFFAFSGVDPGSYKIVATATKDVGSDELDLVVRQGGETELLEPLTLQKRVSLRVAITPPVDLTGDIWQVTLNRAGTANGYAATADRTGAATIADLAPGSYELSVIPRGKTTAFVTRSIEMPRDAVFAIEMKTVRLLGTVRLKDSPLAAAIVWIGGKQRNPGVTLTSNADGAYSGLVPFDPDEPWTVTVSSRSAPTIERTIHQRPVREDEHTVRLDLVLPASAIEGVVLEANGLPAKSALVNVLRADGPGEELMQVRVSGDGRFELVGLEAGAYTVYAEGSAGRTSDRSLVEVSEDEVTSVKLIVGAGLQLSGRLTTQDSVAVAGANVYVNSVEVSTPIWIPRVSSPTGQFKTLLPDATKTVDVFVAARGFAFKAFRAPVNSERELVILLRQNGGSLELKTSAGEDASGRIPYVVHEATAVPLMFFLSNRLATVKQVAGDVMHSVLPNMEAGAYGLCFATAAEIVAPNVARCAFGNLPPFGSLALSVGAPTRN